MNHLIGLAKMRQLRIKSEFCSDRRLISLCEKDYSFSTEEKESFSFGWTNQSISIEDSISKSFKYQSSDILDTYIYRGEESIYSGNGYVYEFDGSLSQIKSNLSKLRQWNWIDEKTRGIIIQMTLYNPHVQLFSSVTFLLEILSSSAIIPSARFEPIDFLCLFIVIRININDYLYGIDFLLYLY